MTTYQSEDFMDNTPSQKYSEAIILAKNIRQNKSTKSIKKNSITLPDGSVECLGKTPLGDSTYKFVPYCVYNANKKRTFEGHTTVKVDIGKVIVRIIGKDEVILTPESSPFVIPAGIEHHISRCEETETICSIYTSKELVFKD